MRTAGITKVRKFHSIWDRRWMSLEHCRKGRAQDGVGDHEAARHMVGRKTDERTRRSG